MPNKKTAKEDSIDIQLLLEQAQETYLAQDYIESADLYDTLTEHEPANPYLMVNAGNSHFQLKNFGKATSRYYKAKAFIPRNKELNNNLTLLTDGLELSQPPLVSYTFFTCFESFVIFLVLNIIFLLRSKIFRSTTKKMVLSFVFALALLNFAYSTYEQKIQQHAVITDVSVQAYSGDDEAYSKLFELLDGQIIEVISQEKAWTKIKVGRNLGWIKNSSMELF